MNEVFPKNLAAYMNKEIWQQNNKPRQYPTDNSETTQQPFDSSSDPVAMEAKCQAWNQRQELLAERKRLLILLDAIDCKLDTLKDK